MAFKSMRDRHPEPTAATLIDLWTEWDADPDFAGFREGARLVPGFGAYPTGVMVVSDYPGAVETAHGQPFSGSNSSVLLQLMSLAGLTPVDTEMDGGGLQGDVPVSANCWITYVFKYLLLRKPTVWHSLKAQPYLRREWDIIGRPRVIVAVGAFAWETLGRVELGGIARNAGQMIPLRGGNFIWPMLHPAYGMAHEKEQPRMERHWEHLGEWLAEEDML